RRIVVTFCFGLVHGFGFATVLSELNLPTADFALALLQFNVGLEIGQLIIVVIATTVLFGLREWPRYRPLVVRGGSFVAMLFAMIWFIERTANLSILPI
ncbi:MAG TPA: HupE/UreJ family protein, partial [Bradyrhizobium sp.]